MKDPRVEKLVVEFKQTLEKLNQTYDELHKENVWVSIEKIDSTKGKGWEITPLKQTVEY